MIRVQVLPHPDRGASYFMHIMVGMPPHIIMAGIPMAIIPDIISQQASIICICEASMGIILQTMPSLVISIDIRHIMGRMPPIIIGMGICMGIMPFIIMGIIPPIICGMGIPIICGIIPGIIIPVGMGIGMDIGISGIAAGVIVGLLVSGRAHVEHAPRSYLTFAA